MTCTTQRTANAIIQEAFKIISVFSEESNLPGKRLKEGLDILNNLLSGYRSSAQLIAYDDVITFNLVVGQRQYEISNEVGADVTNNELARLKFITIEKDNIQYPIKYDDDNSFYESPINLLDQRMPTRAFLQNGIKKSFINFLVLPDYAYLCTIKGKFVLSDLTLNTDITTVPRYYTNYLEYAVAQLLHGRYPGSKWDANDDAMLNKLEQNVMSVADIDLSTNTGSALLNNGYFRNVYF